MLFVLLLTHSALAETWKAQGHGAEFVLDYQVSDLSYQGRVVSAKVPLTACNRSLAEDLMRALKKDLSDPASFTPGEGIRLDIDGQRAMDVRTASAFGRTLLTMDDRFQRFKLAQETACSSSR